MCFLALAMTIIVAVQPVISLAKYTLAMNITVNMDEIIEVAYVLNCTIIVNLFLLLLLSALMGWTVAWNS